MLILQYLPNCQCSVQAACPCVHFTVATQKELGIQQQTVVSPVWKFQQKNNRGILQNVSISCIKTKRDIEPFCKTAVINRLLCLYCYDLAYVTSLRLIYCLLNVTIASSVLWFL